jgi:hypothetical protein
MCIACELSYWAMVDALEAEQKAMRQNAVGDDPVFACEPGTEKTEPEMAPRVQRTADEPTP